MKIINVLKLSLVAMILINIALVFMLFNPSHPPHHLNGRPDLREEISGKLGLNESQKEAYFASAELHAKQMRELNEQQREVAGKYFEGLTLGSHEAQDSLLLEDLRNIDTQKITTTYNHFKQLKEICTPGQKEKFDEVIADFLPVMLGSNQPKPPMPAKH